MCLMGCPNSYELQESWNFTLLKIDIESVCKVGWPSGMRCYNHMWLLGCPNPYKLQQSWEFTFLKVFTHTKTK